MSRDPFRRLWTGIAADAGRALAETVFSLVGERLTDASATYLLDRGGERLCREMLVHGASDDERVLALDKMAAAYDARLSVLGAFASTRGHA